MALNKVEICGVNTASLPVLAPEEKEELFEKIKAGDKEARERYIKGNLRLVLSVIKRFQNSSENADDLFQIGCIGLMKAIDNFDTTLMVKFSTYAVPMIAGEIKRFLRDDGMIKVSRSIKEMGAKVKTARESLCGSLGREPTVEEIAGEIGATREEVAVSMEAAAEVESLYKNVGNGEDKSLCLMDKIEDHRERQEELINHMVLEKLISQLGEKDREIIIRRYFRNQTQTQVAVSLGISQVQVSRLEKKILKQMREQF